MALKVGELFASFDLDASGMNATMRTIENSMEAVGANMVSFGSTMQSAITSPLESFAKQAITAGMDFTSQMSTVEAISGATATEMEKLNAAALEMGSTTQFTATEAGEALEYMAMAGWKTDEMLAGLAPIMNLAAASGEDLGTTSDIVTDALTAFGLKAEDAGHFSDILAVASSNANTNVSMMGETFKYVAPVAGALGYTAEDVAVAIGLMANSGIKAGQAGTSLRAALSKMADPSKEAAMAMEDLGLSLTTSTGEMKPFNTLIQDMRKSFSGLTQAEQVQYAAAIFGQEAMSGMLAIINASDEDIQKLTQSVDECEGATDRMAETVLDNAKGDWTLFKSAVEGAQVALFTLNEGAIRSVIQGMTSLVGKFNGTSDATKQVVLKVAAVAAAIGPVLTIGGKLIMSLSRIGIVLGMLVSPLGMVATGLTVFALAATDANNDIGKAFVSMSSQAKKYLGKLDRYVQNAVKTVSKRMPQLIKSLNTGISTALPKLTSTALNIISSLASMLGDNADGLLSIGTTIIESIVQGIADSLPNLLSALTGVVLSFARALNSGKMRESAINMAKSIIDGLKAVDWSAIGGEILMAICTALTGIVNMIASVFTGAKEAALEVDWAAIPQKIKGAFNFASDWLKGLILGDTLTEESTWKEVGSKVWSWIKSGFSVAESWLENLILGSNGESGGLTGIGEKIITKISESLSSIDPSKITAKMADLSGVATAIIDKIINSKADFVAAAGDLITKIITALGSYTGWSTLTSDFKNVATQIMTSIVNAIGKVAGAAGKVAGAIGTVLSGISLEDITTAASSVAGVIVSGISSKIGSVVSGASSFAAAIGTVLSGITFDDVTTATANVARVVIDGIVAGIKLLVNGATLIAGAISTVLGNINENDWGESIGTLASNLFDAIIDGIADITETPDMSALMQNIGNGIREALTFMGDIAGAIVGYILSVEGLSSIAEAGGNIAKTLILGIGEGLKGLAQGLNNVFMTILGSAIESVLGWFGIEKDAMVEAMNNMTFDGIDGAQITGKALKKIVEGGDTNATIVEQAQAWTALVKAGFEEQAGVADFTPAGVALAKALKDGVLASNPEAESKAIAALLISGMADGFYDNDELMNRGNEAVMQFYSGVEAGTDVITPLLRELGIQVPATLAEALGDEAAWQPSADATTAGMSKINEAIDEMLVSTGETAAQSVTTGVTTGFANAEASVQTSVDTMANIVSGSKDLQNIQSDAQTTGQTAGQAISTGVGDEETNAQTTVDSLVTTMSTAYQPLIIDLATTTQDAMIGINRTILTQRPYNVSTMTYAAQSIINAVKNIMNLNAGYSIGRDLMQGMINGIRAMSGTLASAARSAVSSAISAMRSTAKINSPSKVTEDIGAYMDEGAAIGILGGQMAKAAATAMANTVHEFSKGAYVTDLSRGTVATSRQAAQQNAEAAADRLGGGEDSSYAREVGRAMADRLIETGVFNRKIVMNEREVGEEVADPVSQNIDQKAKRTISGRSAQGVLA